jgi:hypothetical protein
MRKIALLLCVVIALGWLSDMGVLTLKYENGYQLIGIPTDTRYLTTVLFNDTKTTFTTSSPTLQAKVFGSVLFLVNGELVPATRLGNGWLFKFTERGFYGSNRGL